MKILLLAGLLGMACASQVCYAPYGCFTNEAPFDSALILLPENPTKINTKFLLRTQNHPGRDVVLDPFNPAGFANTTYDSANPTMVVSHGYLGNKNEFWVPKIVEALLTKQACNVIFVDWSLGSTLPYFQAAGNARVVGQQVKYLLEQLHNSTGMQFHEVHMIGQGLAAHMLAYAGRDLKKADTPVGRISAMDPVGPWFEYRHEDVRLDRTDALWVDAIHTDTETVRFKGVGTKQNMGHVDFFPNGGTSQPGCWKLDEGVVKWIACSHFRSAELFIESISAAEAKKCPFRQYHCKNYEDFKNGFCTICPPSGCPTLGWNSIEDKGDHEGAFYSQTSANHEKEGFCTWHYNVKLLTGTGIFADLNSVVSITIKGTLGSSETIYLPSHYYPAGSTETFMFHTKHYHGDLVSVRVQTDAWIDSWLLYAVVIRPMWTDQAYTGCYKKWLSNRDSEVTLKGGVEANCPGKPHGQ